MIREATVSDFRQVNELEMQVASKHITMRPDIFKAPQKWSVDEEYFAEMLESDEEKLFVYAEGETVLGYCKVDIEEPDDDESEDDYSTQHDAHIVWINSIFVAEQARGKGIGQSLFEHVKTYAKGRGADRLELCVWALNKEEQGFYERLGMTVQSVALELII